MKIVVAYMLIFGILVVAPAVRAEYGSPSIEERLETDWTVPLVTETARDRIGPYSEKYAYLWSLVSTGLLIGVGSGMVVCGARADLEGLVWSGIGTIAMGFAVPPSFGHLYAKQIWRGTTTMIVRLVLIAVGLVPPAVMWLSDRYSGLEGIRYLGIVGSGALLSALIMAFWDLTTIHRSVDRANAAYRKRLGI